MRDNIQNNAELAELLTRSVRMGVLKDGLLKIAKRQLSEDDSVDRARIDEVAAEIVDNVIGEIKSYSLIEKIMRNDIVKNLKTKDMYVIDYKHKYLERISEDTLRLLFSRKFDIKSKITPCRFEYLPHEPRIMFENDQGLFTFNTYQPPFWYRDCFYSGGKIPLPKVDQIPEEYAWFLDHLVDGDKRSYDYILDWMANMMQDRNYCILATIGGGGIGKGVLGLIMQSLVGNENYHQANNKLLTGQFNAQIMNKRIVYLNEVSIKRIDEEEKLKLLTDDDIEIEKKGVDAETFKNYASFYLSSNSEDAININDDDRRFSLVHLTTTQLKYKRSKDWISRLVDDKELVARFAAYLMQRKYDKTAMMHKLETTKTETVKEASMNEWQSWFIGEYVVDNAGTSKRVKDVGNDVHGSGCFSGKVTPGRTAFKLLANKYPYKFECVKKREGDKQIWVVNIFTLEEQEARLKEKQEKDKMFGRD